MVMGVFVLQGSILGPSLIAENISIIAIIGPYINTKIALLLYFFLT